MRARWQQQRMGRVPVSFNSSCVCMCGCVCVCASVCTGAGLCLFCCVQSSIPRPPSFDVDTNHTPLWGKVSSAALTLVSLLCCFLFFLFFFNWNQFLCTLQSQIICCPSSFCLGIDWPRSSHSEKKKKKKEQSITHTRTHVLARLGKRSRDCSTHFRKAQGQKGEEAPCQVLQLHRCELGFGRAVGRGWSGLAHWSTVGNWWGL